MWFFWTLLVLLQRWLCVYTQWHRGRTEKGQSPECFKIFGKNAISNEHPVHQCILRIFGTVFTIYIFYILFWYKIWKKKFQCTRSIFCNVHMIEKKRQDMIIYLFLSYIYDEALGNRVFFVNIFFLLRGMGFKKHNLKGTACQFYEILS